MKPSFALDFRDGLVTLLHRTSRGWSQVGSTAFDAPDFVEALGYMRSTALGLSPRGITTKLIIPNDQILYTPIHAPGPDAAKRKRQIRAGLEGRTPYPIDDLVYDWWGTGPDLNVAVIARETLAEAEAFATEHRFNPVSFVGVPDNGMFLGEPFFGPTALAGTVLSEGEKVERDSDPVTVIARDFQRGEPKAKAAEPEADGLAGGSQGQASEAAVGMAKDDAPVETAVETDMPVEAVPATVSDSVAETAAETLSKPSAAPATPGADVVSKPEVARPTQPFMPQAERADALPVTDAAPTPVLNAVRPMPPKAEIAPEAPMAMDFAPEGPDLPGDDVTPAPAAEIVAAFATRRSAAIAAASTATSGKAASAATVATAASAASTSASAAASKQASATAPASKIPAVGPAPAQRPTVPRPNVARPAPPSSRDTLPFPVKQNTAPARAPVGKTAKPGGASVTAAGIMGVRRERNVVPLPTSGTPAEQAAAAARRASTKPPTGLGSRSAPIKGKPRYLGLILTVLLLVLLVAVAAWSSFFMGANDTTGTGAGTPVTNGPAASLPAPDPATSGVAATAVPLSVAASAPRPTAAHSDVTAPDAAAQDTEATPGALATDAQTNLSVDANRAVAPSAVAPSAVAPSALASTSAAPVLAESAAASDPGQNASAANPQTAVAAASPAAPQAGSGASDMAANDPSLPITLPKTPADLASAATATALADAASATATHVAEPAPQTEVLTAGVTAVLPSVSGRDKIVVAFADAPPNPVGPMALPVVAAGADASPAAEPPPPPYGTVYKFDAEGRIIPTPEGIITPEGVLLIAGKPKLAPPSRPSDLSPAVPVAAVPTATASSQPAGTETADATGTIASSQPATPGPATLTAIAALPAAQALATETAPAALVPDPTLAGKHPKTKPANLAPAANQQGAAQTTPADSRLASLHPAPRPNDLPKSPLAPDTGADATAASASLAANGFALSSSLKPPARPAGLDQAVDKAVAAALNEPTPDTQLASNNVAPEAQSEPDVEAAAPDMPTNASVAKQATTKRAINTNRLALLAVFGTPSTRFAMIRQGNGAVTKIKVGDTVDGGRVAAITENSVQYQKGGRIVTLSLPTG